MAKNSILKSVKDVISPKKEENEMPISGDINQEDVEAEIRKLKEDIQSYYLEHPDKDPSLPDKIFVKDMNELEEKITEHIPKKVVEDEIIVKNIIEQEEAVPGTGALDFSRMREFDLPDDFMNEVFMPNEKVTDEEQDLKKFVAGEESDDNSGVQAAYQTGVQTGGGKRQKEKEEKQKELFMKFQNKEIGNDISFGVEEVSEPQGKTGDLASQFTGAAEDELVQELFGGDFSAFENSQEGTEALVNEIYTGSNVEKGSGGTAMPENGGNDTGEVKDDGDLNHPKVRQAKSSYSEEDVQEILKELLDEGKLKEDVHLDDSGAAGHTEKKEESFKSQNDEEKENDEAEEGQEIPGNDEDAKKALESLLKDALEEHGEEKKYKDQNADMVNKIFVASSDNEDDESDGSDRQSGGHSSKKKETVDKKARPKAVKEVKEKIQLKKYKSDEQIQEENVKEVKVPVWKNTVEKTAKKVSKEVTKDVPKDVSEGQGDDQISEGDRSPEGKGQMETSADAVGTSGKKGSKPKDLKKGDKLENLKKGDAAGAGNGESVEKEEAQSKTAEEANFGREGSIVLGNNEKENEEMPEISVNESFLRDLFQQFDEELKKEKDEEQEKKTEEKANEDVKAEEPKPEGNQNDEGEAIHIDPDGTKPEGFSFDNITERELVVEKKQIPVPVAVPQKPKVIKEEVIKHEKVVAEEHKVETPVKVPAKSAVVDVVGLEPNKFEKAKPVAAVDAEEKMKLPAEEKQTDGEREVIPAEEVKQLEKTFEPIANVSDSPQPDEIKVKDNELPLKKIATESGAAEGAEQILSTVKVKGRAAEVDVVGLKSDKKKKAKPVAQVDDNVKIALSSEPETSEINKESDPEKSAFDLVNNIMAEKEQKKTDDSEDELLAMLDKQLAGNMPEMEDKDNQTKINFSNNAALKKKGRKRKKAEQKREIEKNNQAQEKVAVANKPQEALTETLTDKKEVVVYRKEEEKSFLKVLLDKLRNIFKPKKKTPKMDIVKNVEPTETVPAPNPDAPQEIQVDGVISGSVQGENIIINPYAIVKQDVEAQGQVICLENATIMGSVKGQIIIVEGIIRGNIQGEKKVVVKNGGLVAGDIRSKQVYVDERSILHGSIYHTLSTQREEV